MQNNHLQAAEGFMGMLNKINVYLLRKTYYRFFLLQVYDIGKQNYLYFAYVTAFPGRYAGAAPKLTSCTGINSK